MINWDDNVKSDFALLALKFWFEKCSARFAGVVRSDYNWHSARQVHRVLRHWFAFVSVFV